MDEKTISSAQSLLLHTREELTRADGKASLLLAAIGVIAGTVVAALISSDWNPENLAKCLQWFWWLGASLGLFGVASLGFSVYPRTSYRREDSPQIISYFGDVVKTQPEDLERLLAQTASMKGKATIDQLISISAIVDKKYRAIQIGMWCVGLSIIVCTLAVIINQFQ